MTNALGLSEYVQDVFDAEAERYDEEYTTAIDRAEDRALKFLLDLFITDRDRVIDLGCGTGKLLDLIAADPMYLGVDVSARMIERARELHPREPFVQYDMTDTPVNGGIATVVTSLYGSPSYALFSDVVAETYRLLEPGGTCLLMPYAIGRFDRKRPVQALSSVFTISADEAQQVMEAEGFELIDVDAFSTAKLDRFARFLPARYLDRVIARASYGAPDDGVFLLATGQKP